MSTPLVCLLSSTHFVTVTLVSTDIDTKTGTGTATVIFSVTSTTTAAVMSTPLVGILSDQFLHHCQLGAVTATKHRLQS